MTTQAHSSNGSNGNGHSLLNSASLGFVEAQYENWLSDPNSVPDDWRDYFTRMKENAALTGRERIGPSFEPKSLFHVTAFVRESTDDKVLQERADQLIRNYRVRGHIIANVDPLDQPKPDPPELHPELYGITEADYDRPLSTSSIGGGGVKTVRELVQRLRNTYCRSIGAQFMHIDSLFVRSWLQERMESTENHIKLDRKVQLRILRKLTDAVVFESFIQKKYLGAKSFSLEGAETLIPLLDMAIEKGGQDGLNAVMIGMAHRGRLNVLANIMGKRLRDIFREFEDIDPERNMGRGDVKYHLGYSNEWVTADKHTLNLTLCFNPSHLEFVNPVAVGKLRAKQDRVQNVARDKSMAILIHGDAAFSGEGVVQETLNMSQLDGYTTGGTIHVIVNNQLGFTTPAYEGRSTTYATDVAKMLQSPIFHVNGEDPEAVAQVIHMAMDFRKKFQRDVVIDMYCYRLRGHNEGDEPFFTQPVMYKAITQRKPVREGYLEKLLTLGGVTREEADQIELDAQERLEAELKAARAADYQHTIQHLRGVWEGYRGGPDSDTPEVETGVKPKRLLNTMNAIARVPQGFHPHPKLQRILESRSAMAKGEQPVDWAMAELMAMATLARSGHRIRLSGQDARRGTFSQRHAFAFDFETGEPYSSLNHLSEEQAHVEIINSPLSEAGVLGFDYGYSLSAPNALVMWEAQFGDFNNAAQVIIDQFIVSAEDKWHRLSGLVMLLPHGFEGQGPEHSSARLERFLSMAAEDNIQIVYPSTPAQHFHVLRRQVLRPWRKPLIVMTPKSLLRHKRCVSELPQFHKGLFQRVLPETAEIPPESVSRILLCSGKIYYDLLEHREEQNRTDVAIVRLEQLYPLPEDLLQETLAPYPDETPVIWVQEEPENMGAWRYLYCFFGDEIFERFPLAGVTRPASASPATGSAHSHKLEQKAVIRAAFEKDV